MHIQAATDNSSPEEELLQSCCKASFGINKLHKLSRKVFEFF